jgi:hypothetical protein
MIAGTAGTPLPGTTISSVVAPAPQDVPAAPSNGLKELHKPVIAPHDPEDWFVMDRIMSNVATEIILNNWDPTKEKVDPTMPRSLAIFELSGKSWSCQEYPIIKDKNIASQHDLRRLVDAALTKTGQLDYLSRIAEDGGCRVQVTIGYYGDRNVRTKAFLHQDGSLFSILMYRNTEPIPGPEIIVNPQGLDWNWRMMQAGMPDSIKKELGEARDALQESQPGEEMLATEIPAHGMIGFLNALCYHATPYPGSRAIRLEMLEKHLDEKLCKPEDEELKKAVRKFMADLPPGTEKLYKPDLVKGKIISEPDAIRLLRLFHAKPLDTVSTQEGKRVPLTQPDRVLKRQLSGILDSGANPFPQSNEPRSFMYILVNVRDQHETDVQR